ncbi:titin [Anabrus simplex]|uniref:titin n=1 Tax=Anabrus simplex TaxID=316456 RepID=UPI0035A39E3E
MHAEENYRQLNFSKCQDLIAEMCLTIIPVTGEIIPFPITVDPIAIDLQICALEEEYKCTFSVHNNSRYVVVITPKLPPSLRSHGKIVPSQQYSRPGSTATFVLEFKPKRSLPCDAAKNKYFDPETEVLDFPISIHCTCSFLGQCPVLKVQILAVVTDPCDMELNPRICNFGTVTTLESVVHCVTITNNSKTVQHYCFTNIPDCVVIQPEYGAGKLSPGEEKELQICYSPQLKHIKGNELVQKSGMSGEHCFILYCATAASADKLIQAKKNKVPQAKISIDTKELEEPKQELEEPQQELEEPQQELEEPQQELEEPQHVSAGQHEANASPINEMEFEEEPKPVDQAETNEINTEEPQEYKEPQLKVVDQYEEPQLEVVDQHEDIEANTKENRSHEELILRTDSQHENNITTSKHSSRRSVRFKPRISELLPSPSFLEAQDFINNYTITAYDSDSEKSQCSLVKEEDIYRNPVKLNDLQLKDKEVPKNIIECYAYVMDPHCELSTYRVKFPVTPCGSFSSVNLFLYGENKSTEPDCRCGVLPAMGHRQFKFHAWFKFTSNHHQVRAIPRDGHILFGEKKKIKLVFRPLLSCDDVDKLAWDLKVEKLKEEIRQQRQSEELQKGKKKKKSSKERSRKSTKRSVVEEPEEPLVDEDLIVLEEADMYPAEKFLLETMEPYTFNVDVKCMVATAPSKAANAPRRIEIHKIRVKCSVVKPDFVIDCNSRKFCFGPVAVNTRPRQDLIVRNITMKDIPVSVNALNREGSFYIPPDETVVAPEHSLTLPVVFGPTEECQKVVEYYEVKSGRTVVPILTTGWAVDAEYNISPDFLVYRFTKVAKGEVCSIEIQNNCVAPLTFNMQQVYLKQAEGAKSTDGAKGKDKAGRDAKAKSKQSKKKTATELSEEEALSLERDFTDIDPDLKEIFTLVDLPNNELIVPPFEKASMKIQFKLPTPEKEKKGKKNAEEKNSPKVRGKGSSKGTKRSASEEKSTVRGKGSSKGTKRSASEGPAKPSKQKKSPSRSRSKSPSQKSKSPQEKPKKETMRYAAYYHLQLGALVFIKEFYFLATVPGTNKTKKK